LAQKQDESLRIHKLVSHHINEKDYDSAIYYADHYIDLQVTDKSLIHGYGRKILVYISFNKFAEAYHLALETKQKICGSNKEIPCSSCDGIHSQLSELMVKIQNYDKALEYLNMTCNKVENADIHYKKALLFIELKQNDEALTTTLESIQIQHKKNDIKAQIRAYNMHGLIARKIGKYDDAIRAFKTAIQIIDSSAISKELKPVVQGNIGLCYFQKGEFEKAYNYAQSDSKGSLKSNSIASYTQAEILLSKIDFRNNEYAKVNTRLMELYNKYQSQLLYPAKSELLEILIKSLKLSGNKKEYIYYSEKWFNTTKSEVEIQQTAFQNLFDAFSKNSIVGISEQMELEKRILDQKLVIQNKESDREELNSWILIGGLMLAMIISLLLFLRYRTMSAQKEIIKEAHLKSVNQEQEILKLKVENESKNVQALSLELEFKQGFSKRIIKELDDLNQIQKPELKKIEIFIQNELDIKSARAELQNKMGDLSSSFYSNVNIKHPELTEPDLKLAAMIAMNMSNKEIGVSKNITDASVKKTKTRLKRKLNLSTEDDLSLYIKSFLG
jgi:DNA-binding CsgD family transcriptional regulator/competence protein ComGC